MKFTFLLLIICAPLLSFSAICTSTGNGNWETAGTWDCPGVPACGDTIYILPGHTVDVTTNNSTLNCGTPSFIVIQGTLDFGNGDKLNLGCGSGITIDAGGQISAAGGGGGASNQITICGAEVWRKSDGNVNGPSSFGNPLPITLLYLTAKVVDHKSVINWATAVEINNEIFILESSRDANNWTEIARLPGAGNSSSTRYYEYNDPLNDEGVHYYRLTQVDFDGSNETFNPVAVNYQSLDDIKLYPNPSNGYLFVDFIPEDMKVNYDILNSVGQLIQSSKQLSENNTIDLNHLKSGLYYIKLSNSEDTVYRQIQIR